MTRRQIFGEVLSICIIFLGYIVLNILDPNPSLVALILCGLLVGIFASIVSRPFRKG